jgi:DNA-directed RNA polymerase subunit RPC12/RpoP
MRRCPYCKKRINYLVEVQEGAEECRLYRNGNYNHCKFVPNIDWDTDPPIWNHKYICPKCRKEISVDRMLAIDFLEGHWKGKGKW